MIIVVGSDLRKLKKRISDYIRSSNNMVNTEGQIRRSLQRLVSFERKVTFDGTEKVQLERVEKDEFCLPSEDRVAHYDAEMLASFWNKENNQYSEIPSISNRICNGLKMVFLVERR